MKMVIQIGQWRTEVDTYEGKNVIYSKVTNENLQLFTINLSVNKVDVSAFNKVFDEYKDGALEIWGTDYNYEGKKFSGKLISTNFIGSDKVMYTIELEEISNKKISELHFGGLCLIPYDIKQDVEDGAVIIEAKTIVSEREMYEINNLRCCSESQYFDVIRVGVSDEPLKMRFGRNLWSKNDEEYKMIIVLVEEIYDQRKNDFHGFSKPELDIAIEKIIELSEVNERLLRILVENNLISKNQKDKILQDMDIQEIQTKLYMFDRVKNVDEW